MNNATRHLIYNTKTQNTVREYGAPRIFESKRGAAIALAAILRRQVTANRDDYLIITPNEFLEKYDPMVETTNLMSGKKVMIRQSEKGSCTDVGTERYWAM